MPAPVPPEAPPAYFERLAPDRFRATEHTGGAWSVTEQHVSPLNGLLVHVLDRFVAVRAAGPGAAADGLATARITFDILGVVPIGEVDVSVEVVRPGRTIELLEAVAVAGGRAVLRARAWRLARSDTRSVAGGGPGSLPPPDGLAPAELSGVWPGGYIASLDVRPLHAPEPGRATVWLATPVALVADEPVSELARFVGLVDTANGIAVRRSPREWLFPNVDLTVHLHRQPVGPWVGLDTTVVFGPDGAGLTTSVLHDRTGPVGRSEQLLTVRALT
ncbi:Thioesterase-like superfamily protein [Geodermatophilus africanus]|uniref:Thioesterase-like superfamily protein n=1 Tax=Geodermatophilus africanus TaxID=1137993 RepID=A0A1H3QW43_9ACTN|nr:thioesterase family protein [Geodermatophilus africanus]SDZ17596.1 Thioesterase-like superfamily protein [Geodermatophilus africanus]